MMEERFIRYCADLMLLPHDTIVRQRGQPLYRLEKVQGRFKITLCSAENALPYITLSLAHPILADWSNSYMPVVRNIYPAQKQNYISR